MRSKEKYEYICRNCGYSSPKWLGKCPQCGEWDSFDRQNVIIKPKRFADKLNDNSATSLTPLPDINLEGFRRIDVGFEELNRVLGGGLVPCSVNLLGGEPGIGKSTILLQIAGYISQTGGRVIYITGEESAIQIKNRAERLKIDSRELLIGTETDIKEIIRKIDKINPTISIIDSIQAVYDQEVGGFPGTVGQIRESTAACIDYAKKTDTSFILAGHITKDGTIAGPKLLEHLVDTVLYFEGDKDYLYRIIRGVKNRFGPAGEIGVFEMRSGGLREVKNPSAIFLGEYLEQTGSVITPIMEGSRPFLIEVQALAAPSGYSVSQRVSVGFDSKKLSLITAICEKKGGIRLSGMDIFVKILGGIKVDEAAVDLPMALALYTSINDLSIPAHTVVFGELGLGGELRGVPSAEYRIAEASRMNFKNIILPSSNAANLPQSITKGINIIKVSHINQAFNSLNRQ